MKKEEEGCDNASELRLSECLSVKSKPAITFTPLILF